jgi:hypothetical protein
VAEGPSQPTMEADSDGFREADSIHQSHTTPGGGGGGGEGGLYGVENPQGARPVDLLDLYLL